MIRVNIEPCMKQSRHMPRNKAGIRGVLRLVGSLLYLYIFCLCFDMPIKLFHAKT